METARRRATALLCELEPALLDESLGRNTSAGTTDRVYAKHGRDWSGYVGMMEYTG